VCHCRDMVAIPDIRIAELLAGRLCHELIGPAAAVENGVELLLDEDPDLTQEALALVAESARRTTSRLQFYRFAYGFNGEGPAAGAPPCDLAARYFATTRITCRYRMHARSLALAQQKLGCNLLLVGLEALARGGTLTLDAAGSQLEVEMTGETVDLAPEQREALALKPPIEALTPRTVQAYFTGLLARGQGLRLIVETIEPGTLRMRSVTTGA
jgi:histidine phosphotransferase ChpT